MFSFAHYQPNREFKNVKFKSGFSPVQTEENKLEGLAENPLTVLLGAYVDLLAPDAVACVGEGQHLDAVVSVLLQAVQLQRGLAGGHVTDFPQF